MFIKRTTNPVNVLTFEKRIHNEIIFYFLIRYLYIPAYLFLFNLKFINVN